MVSTTRLSTDIKKSIQWKLVLVQVDLEFIFRPAHAISENDYSSSNIGVKSSLRSKYKDKLTRSETLIPGSNDMSIYSTWRVHGDEDKRRQHTNRKLAIVSSMTGVWWSGNREILVIPTLHWCPNDLLMEGVHCFRVLRFLPQLMYPSVGRLHSPR